MKKLQRLKPYLVGLIIALALLLIWILKRTRFIVFMTIPQLLGIFAVLAVLVLVLLFLL